MGRFIPINQNNVDVWVFPLSKARRTHPNCVTSVYNKDYRAPAEAMRLELADKGLLKENPWTDEFQITHYYLWRHEGRRARQGAMMGAHDWAHRQGFFDLQLDLYKLEAIYNKRLETGEIED